MSYRILASVVTLLSIGVAAAQDAGQRDIRRAKIKSLDLDHMQVTLIVDDKDLVLTLTEDTQILGASGDKLRDRMKGIEAGSDVFFQVATRNGKQFVRAMRLVGAARPSIKKFDTSAFQSLMELGSAEYHGFKGGLYPEGKNERPAAHEAAGRALGQSIRPRDREGNAADDGKIVLLSIGMSNATQEFSAFKQTADADRDKNPKLVIVDGAQGGMTAAVIRNPDDGARGAQYWSTVDQRLEAARVSRHQVQVAWVKEADAGPTQGFPKYAETLQSELGDIARLLHARFPNLELAYLSCRTYGGYATTPLNPEPYAYESGFAVKWLIEQQIQGVPSLNFDPSHGDVRAPWLSWGPYLWANGTRPNSNGLKYEESDFGEDGTHPSASGRRKVAQLLLEFFKRDTTAAPWFVAK